MKLTNDGKKPIALRYGVHKKDKKGMPGDYSSHTIVLAPGGTGKLPDELDHVSIERIDKVEGLDNKLWRNIQKGRKR